MREYHSTALLAAFTIASVEAEHAGLIGKDVSKAIMDRAEDIFGQLLRGEVTDKGVSITPQEGSLPCMDRWVQSLNTSMLEIVAENEPSDATIHGYKE